MSPQSKCSVIGCSKPSLADRMFCATHIEDYPVSNVASVITEAQRDIDVEIRSDRDRKELEDKL